MEQRVYAQKTAMSFRRYLANLITPLIPPTRAYRLKRSIWCAAGVDAAASARLMSSVRIWTAGPVSIGSDTFLGHEVMIVGGDAPIHIGARCDLAPRVMLVTGTHLDGEAQRAAGQGVSHPISIGNGVWIGAGATILGGVEIGDGVMVAAGSLVNQSVPSQTVVGGVPARIIRQRLATGSS